MPSKGISTAGMTLMWGVGASGNVPPISAITHTVPEVKSMPSFNPTPATIDITPLSEKEFVLYTQGLKDLGGAMEFGANLTDELITEWGVVVAASNALSGSNAVWFAIVHPKLSQATYFQGTPIPIGLNEASVNSALETTLYVTPNSAPVMAAKPGSSGEGEASAELSGALTGVSIMSFTSDDDGLDDATLSLSGQLSGSTRTLTISQGTGMSGYSTSVVYGTATVSDNTVTATGNGIVTIALSKSNKTSVLSLDMSFFTPSVTAQSGTITLNVSTT